MSKIIWLISGGVRPHVHVSDSEDCAVTPAPFDTMFREKVPSALSV